MTDKIRVLNIVGMMDIGGTETLLMNILRNIDREKFQIDFVVQTNKEKYDYEDEITGLGSVIYRSPMPKPENIYEVKKWWKDFFKEHQEYDIVHGHAVISSPYYLSEAKKAGIYTIFHSHSNSLRSGFERVVRNTVKFRTKNMADFGIACSKDAGIIQFGKKGQFDILKNGIHTERYIFDPDVRRRVRDEFGFGDTFVIGNVARLNYPKNHEFLFEVFEKVLLKHQNSYLLLVGKGPKEEQYREIVKSKGIEDRVVFAGARNDVNEILQAMDSFVLPSLFEGLGIAGIEAQASGLPCFMSDTVAADVKITELVKFISLEESVDTWADTILSCSLNMERCDTSKYIADAGYDIMDTVSKLIGIYEEAVNGK